MVEPPDTHSFYVYTYLANKADSDDLDTQPASFSLYIVKTTLAEQLALVPEIHW